MALTREWAAELLGYGIRVNAVIPAEVMTRSTAVQDYMRSANHRTSLAYSHDLKSFLSGLSAMCRCHCRRAASLTSAGNTAFTRMP